MNTSEIVDGLSLRGLTTEVSSYLKEHCASSKAKTVKGLLEILFQDVLYKTPPKNSKPEEGPFKVSIVELQKAVSGSPVSSAIRELGEQIAWSSAYDGILRERIPQITADIALAEIGGTPGELYSQLIKNTSPFFFSQNELKKLRELERDHKYDELFLCLLKHGFATLDTIPQRIAQRLYEEALTYDPNSPTRFLLFKAAADQDHKLAALEYGGYMNRTRENGSVPEADTAVALTYTLKALPLAPAFWNLAYMLENHQLNESQVAQVISVTGIDALIGKLWEKEQGSRIRIDAENYDSGLRDNPRERIPDYMFSNLLRYVHPISGGLVGESNMLAFKICYYLAFGENRFYKAFNSMAKYCDTDNRRHAFEFFPVPGLRFQNGHELAVYFYQIAIQGGSPPAMYNYGKTLFKELKETLKNESSTNSTEKIEEIGFKSKYMECLLEASAETGFASSYETLGDYYQLCKKFDRAFENYRKAIEIAPSAEVFFKLADIDSNDDNRRLYYEKALAMRVPNAAYYLAQLDYLQFSESNEEEKSEKVYLLTRALSKIRRYRSDMDNIIGAQVDILQAQIQKQLISFANAE